MDKEHNYAVIMAGGAGTRLWPMSRQSSPKQFQALFGNKTLIQQMFSMLQTTFANDHIFVQTPEMYETLVAHQLPDLPKENILLEPEHRDTAAAFAYATASIINRDEDANIGVFFSDHIVKDLTGFTTAVTTAFLALPDFPDRFIMIGVKPNNPDTGLGYIQMQYEAKRYGNEKVFYVDKFIEKPDEESARNFVKSWQYLWNTGYQIYKGQTFFTFLEQTVPDLKQPLESLRKAIAENDADAKKAAYARLPKISFSYLAIEKLKNLLVVPSDMDWSDIGDWNVLHGMLKNVTGQSVVTNGATVSVDTQNSLILGSQRLIATLGVKDLIIIDTPDALLIADKHDIDEMKKLYKDIESDPEKKKYL